MAGIGQTGVFAVEKEGRFGEHFRMLTEPGAAFGAVIVMARGAEKAATSNGKAIQVSTAQLTYLSVCTSGAGLDLEAVYAGLAGESSQRWSLGLFREAG